MAWTYTDPSTTYRDAIRLEIGDTLTADQQLTDAEISALAAQRAGILDTSALPADLKAVYIAAADCERSLAAKFARQPTWGVGTFREQASDRNKFYLAAAKRHDQLATSFVAPMAGGQKISEKTAASQDTDAVPPAFKVDQDDKPSVVTPIPPTSSFWP